VSPVPTIPIQAMEALRADVLADRLGPTIMLTLRTLTCLSGFHVLRAFTTKRALPSHGSKQLTMLLRHLILGLLFC
jgi:hypothetical protein